MFIFEGIYLEQSDLAYEHVDRGYVHFEDKQ